MILRVSFLLVLLIVAPAAFIYIARIQHSRHRWLRRLFLVPNIVLLVLTAWFGATDSQIHQYAEPVAIYLVVFLLICVPEAVYAIAYGLSLLSRRRKVRRVGSAVGFAMAGCFFAVIAVAVVACFSTLRVNRHEFASPDLPAAFDGYKIVHVSDLHLGTFRLYPRALRRVVAAVNGEHADLVAFTGDLVNFDDGEAQDFLREMSEIRAADGVASVMGNHDYLMYVKYAGDTDARRHIAALQDAERAAGWRLLLNEHFIVRRGSDSIAIVGSENDGRPPFPHRGDLPAALRGLPEGCFKVLLTHDPTQWRAKVLPTTDIQLTLSGHTHAGQIKVHGHSVSERAYREWNGMYHSGDRAIFVSSGVGEALVPFRLGAWPSIDVITLKKK